MQSHGIPALSDDDIELPLFVHSIQQIAMINGRHSLLKKLSSFICIKKLYLKNMSSVFLGEEKCKLTQLLGFLSAVKRLECTSMFLQVSNHIGDDCPLTIIPCPYARMGCRQEVTFPLIF